MQNLSRTEVTKCQQVLIVAFEVSEVYLPYLKDNQLYYALLGFRDHCKSHPKMLK